MNKLIDIITNKINEYNIGLLSDYEIEDGHCFITPGMIIFLHHDNRISIAFQADQKPEDVASYLLILIEIEGIAEISVLDSFIHDENKKFISGEAAHDLIKKSIMSHAIHDFTKTQIYNDILTTAECFNC